MALIYALDKDTINEVLKYLPMKDRIAWKESCKHFNDFIDIVQYQQKLVDTIISDIEDEDNWTEDGLQLVFRNMIQNYEWLFHCRRVVLEEDGEINDMQLFYDFSWLPEHQKGIATDNCFHKSRGKRKCLCVAPKHKLCTTWCKNYVCCSKTCFHYADRCPYEGNTYLSALLDEMQVLKFIEDNITLQIIPELAPNYKSDDE